MIGYHQQFTLEIYQAESLLHIKPHIKYQLTMNDIIAENKKLLADGKIAASQYIGQAIFWCCKSNSK
jgi:hypothetical protein